MVVERILEVHCFDSYHTKPHYFHLLLRPLRHHSQRRPRVSLSYVLLFCCGLTGRPRTTAIGGGIAIQAGFLVSFKQLVPEHTVTLFRGVLSMRVKHFPAIFLLANTISGVLLGTDTAMLLAWCGFFVSWVYLRFYRISPSLFSTSTGVDIGTGQAALPSEATLKGDASDTFSFAAFWPDVVQPPIAALSDAVYNVVIALRLCTPFSAADVDAGNEQANAREGGKELPSLLQSGRGGARGEAERRRQLALRALDQRLNAAQQTKPQSARAPGPAAVTPKTESEDEQPQTAVSGSGDQAQAGNKEQN